MFKQDLSVESSRVAVVYRLPESVDVSAKGDFRHSRSLNSTAMVAFVVWLARYDFLFVFYRRLV